MPLFIRQLRAAMISSLKILGVSLSVLGRDHETVLHQPRFAHKVWMRSLHLGSISLIAHRV
jgi:hypothetical protein